MHINWYCLALLVSLCCCLVSCLTPPGPATDQPTVNITAEPTVVKETAATGTPTFVLPYTGKYPRELIEPLLRQIKPLRDETLRQAAAVAGLVYEDRGEITVVVRDWQPDDGWRSCQVATTVKAGQFFWTVSLVAEQLVSGATPIALVLPQAWLEAVVAQLSHDRRSPLPTWLSSGIVWYALQQPETVACRLLAPFVESNHSVAEIIQGVAHPVSPSSALEGWLALVYFREMYGEAKLKKWLQQAVWQPGDWETELVKLTGADFAAFQDRAAQFAVTFLSTRHWPDVIAYRQALRHYVLGDYPEAIPQLKKLYLQMPDSLVSGNLVFWLGMCYYKTKRYHDAASYFADCFNQFGVRCLHSAVARYRHALCLYHERQLAQAVVALADFLRDYPYHELCPSAHFFVAEALAETGESRRAYEWYAQLPEKFGDHDRANQADSSAAALAQKLGWLGRAKFHYRRLLSRKPNAEERVPAEELLQQLAELEQGGVPPSLARALDGLVDKFASQNRIERQATLEELVRVGQKALPWLERLAGLTDQAILPDLIAALAQLEDNTAAPLLVSLLKTKRNFCREILLALIRSGMPIALLETVVRGELPRQEQDQAALVLGDLLWDTPPALRQQFPKLLCQLNGTATEQLAGIEAMAVKADNEQIPVLLKLAAQGYSVEVCRQATENLIVWHDPRAIPVFYRLLEHEHYGLRAKALQGLAALGEYPLKPLQALLQTASPESRLWALAMLAKAQQISHDRLLVSGLEDALLEIRDRSKQLLLAQPVARIVPILCETFGQERHSLYYYTGIAELLEKLTGKPVSYSPDMSATQRQQAVAHLKGS